jgi:hypothetical protein
VHWRITARLPPCFIRITLKKKQQYGYNFLPLLTGKVETGPPKEIFYFSDDGDLTTLRFNDWKMVFMEQKAKGTFRVWMEPFVPLRVPLIFNLRRDPYERAELPQIPTTIGYWTERTCSCRPKTMSVVS